MADRDFLDKLSRQLADEGKLVEAGFVSFRAICLPRGTAAEIENARMIFFAGAQHLFGSINAIMDEDREPTEADLSRMSLIDQELRAFIDEFKARLARGDGQR
jgi:hypothetical protein